MRPFFARHNSLMLTDKKETDPILCIGVRFYLLPAMPGGSMCRKFILSR